MTGTLKRFWVLLTILLALVVAVAVVSRLRTFFDSDQPYAGAPEPPDVIVPTNVKRITYEVTGPPGATGRVSYLDVKGKTQEAGFTVPWSVTVSTLDPGILANVVAQGDGATLSCRILVDDEPVVESTAEGDNAQAFCLVKAA